MNGILPLWKECGMTSHDCVFQLRKILKMKRIGHTGTLDPQVDGVLPICLGPATKVAEFMTDMGKQYEGEITIGFSTTTEDAHGEVVDQKAVEGLLSEEEIDRQMTTFIGEITQIPPMYSAVKVNGKRLYEYARNGETVERPKRKANIYQFKRTSTPVYNSDTKTVSWTFAVSCGKGTYVRTLAVDLGERLGYPAHMSQLTRTKSGPFAKEQCYTLDQVRQLAEENKVETILMPIEGVFDELPAYHLNDELWQRVKNGAVIENEAFDNLTSSELIAFYYGENLVALYENHPKRAGFKKPRKMFLSSF